LIKKELWKVLINHYKLMKNLRNTIKKNYSLVVVRILKITSVVLLTLFINMLTSEIGYTQNKQNKLITLKESGITLENLFKTLEQKSNYRFLYRSSGYMDLTKTVNVNVENKNINEVLDIVLANSGLKYTLVGTNLIVIAPLSQQKISVTGKITDKSGEPLVGVSVSVKGTKKGTVTNNDGIYSIDVETSENTLVFSFLGMVTKEAEINDNKTINMVMDEDASLLDELMVIAYGTQIKRNITGSVGSVNEFGTEKTQVGNVMTGLQGRVPGLWVRKLDGSPNASLNFVIRGNQANNMNSQPLIVIDGMIVDSKDNFNFSSIAPQDIESIEILKDAASSAMYGSRGAMGVVQITTKQGSAMSKPKVNFSAYYGIVNSPMNYRMLNCDEYKMIFDEARNNRIGYIEDLISSGGLTTGQIATLQSEITRYRNEINNLQMGDNNIDWINEIIPDYGFKSDLHFSLSGGDSKTSYYFSLGRNSEEYSIGTGKFTRLSAKLSLSNQTYDWLKISGNLAISQAKTKNYTSSITVLSAASVRPDTPYEPMIKDDGKWGYWFGSQQHPLLVLRENDNLDVTNNFSGNFKADVNIVRGLVWTSALSGTISQNRLEAYYSPQSYSGQNLQGNYTESGSNGHRITANTFLNYNLDLGPWNIASTLGFEYNENNANGFGTSIVGFPGIEGLEAPGNGSSFVNSTIPKYTRRLERSESIFFRSNLAFKDRYLMSVSVRRDGTSKLVKENRYSNFPAVSAGWIISEEDFMSDQKFFSLLKLRASYGITGSIANVNMADSFDYVTSSVYFGQSSLLLPKSMGNPGLEWEKTKQFDTGLDIDMLASRLTATIEWYYKYTSGMITSQSLSSTTGGFTSRKINAGDIRNRGLDLSIRFRNHTVSDFSYTVGLNMNINRSKVVDLPTDKITFTADYYGGNSPLPRMKIGQPFGALEMYKALGIDKNGDVIYWDGDGNGTITADDRIIVSNLQPDFTGGFDFELNYRGFSLFGQFAMTYGGEVYNCDEHFPRTASEASDGVMANLSDYLLDRWTPENTNSRYPRYIVGAHGPQNETGWNEKCSTLYLFDASFLKLNKITLAYDLPSKLLERINISGCRLYMSGENVLTIKNRDLNMPDPEAALNSGLAQKATPSPRSFMVGIDLTF
jgi:TonB-linked SusC/RagA family outer membrane protein